MKNIDKKLLRKPLFNENGDTETEKKRMVGGNTTNLNDFNNLKYPWTNVWYRQAMNNFWIPEEINLSADVKDYRRLDAAEKTAFDKILSFLIFLDSVQTANLPNLIGYITANEVNLCLTIQSFQEAIHSQSYSYMLDTICSPDERNSILYQWRDDKHLLERNKFIGGIYEEFLAEPSIASIIKTMVANYILEGIYFYSGFMFFYNLGRNNKMPGSVQEIRYINRDENTHLWLFRSILTEMQSEHAEYFIGEYKEMYRTMIKDGCEKEIAWGKYVIGNAISGLNETMITDYIQFLGNKRCADIGLDPVYEDHETEPDSMAWVSRYSNANLIKTDFFEARNTAYAKSASLVDDL